MPRLHKSAARAAFLLAAGLMGFAWHAPGFAQPAPEAGESAAPTQGPQLVDPGRPTLFEEKTDDSVLNGPDRAVGSVDGHPIFLSDMSRAAKSLPEAMRKLPFETVMPVLLDRMIDHMALTMSARRAGLDRDPAVRREIDAATDQVLESAWLARTAAPQVTEAAIEARYNQIYLNRPPTEEVRARHILVGSEEEANKIIGELRAGADFAAIARVVSKDPDSRNGGDLGFFRRDQVWAEFADVAFSLKPGQTSTIPVHNEFGWHIVKVEERRLIAPPTLSEIHDQLRKDLIAQAVSRAIEEARRHLIVRKFNLDGTEIDPPASGTAAPR